LYEWTIYLLDERKVRKKRFDICTKTLRHFESNAEAFLKKAATFSKFAAANSFFAAAYLNSAVNFPKTSRLENRCHTCQKWVNVFITNNFL